MSSNQSDFSFRVFALLFCNFVLSSEFDTMIPHSVLSHPIDASHGNLKATLDYFTEEANEISLRSHLRSQLLRLREVSAPEKYVMFNVVLKKELEMAAVEIFRELSFEKESKSKNVYVYEKDFN